MYRVVFDASDAAPPLWFAAFGLIFVAVGFVLVIKRRQIGSIQRFWREHPGCFTAFAYFFLGFSILWTTIATVGITSDWIGISNAAKSGKEVTGPVENFHPMPYTGHEDEHFTVDGVYFAYSDYGITGGFNNTSSHGGPIHAGLFVRIHYLATGPNGNVIAKLEIRS